MICATYLETPVNDFLSQNGWWIALIVAGLIVVVVVAILLIGKMRKKGDKGEEKKKVDYRNKEAVKSSYFDALGGEDNILEKRIEGSRIVLKLKDYAVVDKEKIKEAGVDGFIKMSDKLYLVVKDDAAKVYKILFGE